MKRLSFLVLLTIFIGTFITSCKGVDLLYNNEKQVVEPIVNKDKDDVIDSGPVKGGDVKLFSTVPDTLNPILTNNTYVQEFSSLIFDSMIKMDRNQKPVPSLADKWEISPDGLVWNFHLKENVQWHDKMPLTAEDVEFTLETILNTASNSVYKSMLQNIATFTAIDRANFRIILKKPYSFTAELMTFPIIPKHYYMGENVFKLDSKRNMSPVGTGPYRFVEYKPNDNIKLLSSENWWNAKVAGKGKLSTPYIAEVNIKIYRSAGDVANAFQAKDIDIFPVGRTDFSKYAGRAELITKKYISKSYDYIAFNFSKPVLQDKNVRQAIAYAIDKAKLVNDVLPGAAIAADMPIIPGTWFYQSNIITYVHSIQEAKTRLAESGYKEEKIQVNNNGVKTEKTVMTKYYTPLYLEMLVNEDDEVRLKIAEKIRVLLADIGIDLKIISVDWEDEMKRISSRKFDMLLIGCKIPSVPDISFMYSSTEIGALNTAGYKNADVDYMLQQILNTNDNDKKKAVFLNMRDIIDDEIPYIGLYYYDNAVICTKKIKGGLNPYIWDKFSGFTDSYVPISVR